MLARCRRLALASAFRPMSPWINSRKLSSSRDTYHPKVSLLPFTNDTIDIQSKLDILIPAAFGVAAAIKGYAQMILGPDVIDSGIKRTNFKPVYIPTWTVDCVASFTSRLSDSEYATVIHLRDVIVPGLNHYPLGLWVRGFPGDIDNAKPFSEEHLEPIKNKHDILALPFTTSPVAIPQILRESGFGEVDITEEWSFEPRTVKFQMLAAYPLLHPAFLAEYTMGEKHITALAHGYYEHFSIWGYDSFPDQWFGSLQSANVPYIRSRKPIIGGTAAVPDFIFDETTTENLEKITREVDMNDLRIQPISLANATRQWMTLAAKVDDLEFYTEAIPTGNAHVFKIELAGFRAKKPEVRGEGTKKQLEGLKADADAAKPEWLKEWEIQNSQQ